MSVFHSQRLPWAHTPVSTGQMASRTRASWDNLQWRRTGREEIKPGETGPWVSHRPSKHHRTAAEDANTNLRTWKKRSPGRDKEFERIKRQNSPKVAWSRSNEPQHPEQITQQQAGPEVGRVGGLPPQPLNPCSSASSPVPRALSCWLNPQATRNAPSYHAGWTTETQLLFCSNHKSSGERM